MPKKPVLKKGMFSLLVVLWVAVLSVWANSITLPEAVVRAHTIYLQNDTGFAELEYTAILELNKWGRFDLAERAEKADLILRLDSSTRVRVVPDGQIPGAHFADDSSVPAGYTRIALLDPKSDQMLWSDLHKTEGAKVKSGHLLDGLRDAFRSYEKSRH
jgi:hypothetical protein